MKKIDRTGALPRRHVLAAWLAACASVPAVTRAQAPDKKRRVGILVDGSAPHPIAEALPRDLASLGYVDGRNVTFEVRYAEGRSDRAKELAAELVRLGVDVIVAHFTPAVRAAMDATKSVPIVMAPAGAPVESGLVASLSRPGGNVTGITNMAAELGGRRLQLLKDIVPSLHRVAALASNQDPFTKPFLHYMQEAAPRAGIALDPILVAGPAEFEAAFATMARDNAQAVVVQAVFNSNRTITVDLAMRHRLALMSFDHVTTKAGGLISISADSAEIFKRVASIVDRILKGASPANLPVEQPTTFEMAVNLKTAKALGLVVPPSILLAADEVIE